MEGIAQQAGELFGQRPGDLGRHRHVEVLLLAQPAQDIAAEHADAPFAGRPVRAAGMIDAAEEETDRALGHDCLDRLRLARTAAVGPEMAARNEPRGAVFGGKVGQRPERGAGEIAPGAVVQRIKLIAPVQRLRRLIGSDRRDRVGRELIGIAIGAERAVDQRQHRIVGDEIDQARRLGEERVQPLRPQAEKIRFSRRFPVQVRLQIFEQGVDRLVRHEVPDDDAAIRFEDAVDFMARNRWVDHFDAVGRGVAGA